MMRLCPRNHPISGDNAQPYGVRNGTTYLRCRTCNKNRMNLKYRNDEAWRNKHKTRTLARYYAARINDACRAENAPFGLHAQTKAQPEQCGAPAL